MTWLQFVLPIYIWLLVGLIATLCNFSTTAAEILSSTNPIAVIATLFLLSYTKLLVPSLLHFLSPPWSTQMMRPRLCGYMMGTLDTLTRMMAGTLIPLHVFGQPCGVSVPLPACPTLSFYQCILCWTSTSSSGYHGLTIYLKMKSFLVQDAHHAP